MVNPVTHPPGRSILYVTLHHDSGELLIFRMSRGDSGRNPFGVHYSNVHFPSPCLALTVGYDCRLYPPNGFFLSKTGDGAPIKTPCPRTHLYCEFMLGLCADARREPEVEVGATIQSGLAFLGRCSYR